MRQALAQVVPNGRQHFCSEMAGDREHIYAANGRGIQSPGPRKTRAWKWMSPGSGMRSCLREEAFVLESVWLKHRGANWPICLALSNYQTKVKIWDCSRWSLLGLELDVGPGPWIKCCFPHPSFALPPQRPHLHQQNKMNPSWKIIYTGKVESGKQDQQAIWKILTRRKMLFP